MRFAPFFTSLAATLTLGLWPFGGVAAGANLLLNSDFATDLSGWETDGTAFNTGQTAVLSDQGGNRVVLWQTAAVPENTIALHLSFDLLHALSSTVGLGQTPDSLFITSFSGSEPFGSDYSAGEFDDALVVLDVDFRGPTNAAPGLTSEPLPERPGWTRYTLPLEVTPFVTVAFEFIDGNGLVGDSTAALDNVVLEAVPIPEPAVGLLLAGVGLAFWRRRRRERRAGWDLYVSYALWGLYALSAPTAFAQTLSQPLPSAAIRATATAERSTLNRTTGVLTSTVDITATNISGRRIDSPVLALIDFTTPEGAPVTTGVTVPDAQGGPGQQPSFDLTASLGPDGWQPATTLSFTLSFSRARTLSVLYNATFAGRLNQDPLVNSGGPYTGRVGEPVAFSGAATDPDGDPLTFTWDFGGNVTASTAQASHTFATAGAHEVTLTVDDGRGGVVTREVTALIIPEGDFALAHTRVVDGTGHPLGGTLVEETGPDGPESARAFAVEDTGFVSLGAAAGNYVWKFSASGHLPAWRARELIEGEIRRVPSPWLARQAAPVTVSVLDPTTLTTDDSAESARLSFPEGAFTQPGAARLTALGPQTLPLPLPFGWSPLAAFHVALPETPAAPGQAHVRLAETPADGDFLTLVKFDEAALAWIVLGDGAVDPDAPDRYLFPLDDGGTYAVLARDEGTGAPLPNGEGEPLRAGTPQDLAAAVTAAGVVRPEERPASLDPAAVTAEGEVVFTPAAGVLPSGSWFRLAVQETYDLADGTGLRTPDYDATVYAYRRPVATGAAAATEPTTPIARFPLRPRLLFSPAELQRADLHVEVLPPLGDGLGILSAEGGVLQAGGLRVTMPPGVFGAVSAGSLRALDAAGFADLTEDGFSLAAAFELNVAGLAPGAALTFAPTAAFTPNASYVLAKVVSSAVGSGLTPVQRLTANAAGLLADAEPATDPRLPGLTSGGVFVLIQVESAPGLVRGVVRGVDTTARGGVPARVEATPWLALTASEGGFTLLAPAGEGLAAAVDPAEGSSGVTTFTLDDLDAGVEVAITLAVTGPSVVSISPADGATKVRAAEPIVVRFSEPLDPASLNTSAFTVTNPLGVVVQGSLTLNLAGTVATFLPVNPLEHAATYTVELAATIRDRQGQPLEGQRTFTFSVIPFFERPAGAQLVIYEPGADNIPAEVLSQLVGYNSAEGSSHVVAHGSPGTADPEVPVILVNQNTGATATVLSKPDGSFANFLDAAEEDFIEAVFVNSNGTRVTVPATRQLYDNGKIGLYKYGGILEAESDGGPVQVLIEPHAIKERSVFKMETFTINQLLQATGGVLPEGDIKALPGIQVTVEGEVPEGETEVSIPFDPSTMGFEPGLNPEAAPFALSIPIEIEGQVVFMVVDKMRYENGRLFTNTCPFRGAYSPTMTEVVVDIGANFLNMSIGGGLLFGFSQAFLPLVISTHFEGTVVNGTVARLPVEDINLIDATMKAQMASMVLNLIPAGRGGNFLVDTTLLAATVSLHQLLARAEPVQGALVSMSMSETSTTGRIQPGLVCAVSDENGCYSLNVPVLAGFLGATHPRFGRSDSTPLGVLDLAGSGTRGFVARNILFGTSLGEFTGRIPRLSITHSPLSPALDEDVTLTVDAFTQARHTVDIRLGGATKVETLVLGETVTRENLNISDGQVTVVEPGHHRFTATLRADKALLATLRVFAESSAGQQFFTAADYALAFGFGRPQVPNALAPADPNDREGPYVVAVEPRNDETIYPGQTVRVRFSEPLDRALLGLPSPVTFQGTDVAAPFLDLSEDQQTLLIQPTSLPNGGTVTVTFGADIRDLAGNAMPSNAVLTYKVGRLEEIPIPGVLQGGGSVLDNGVLYVLDRGGGGSVRIYEADPTSPRQIASIPPLNTPSALDFPRDLVVIRDWPHVPGVRDGNNLPEVRRSLLAVVGGVVGSVAVDDLGNATQNGQYLTLFDISRPTSPALVVNVQLTARPSTVPKIRWEPPQLVYLENSADTHFVSFIDLQELLVGFSVPLGQRAQVFANGIKGEDLDFNGSYEPSKGEKVPWPKISDVTEFMGFKLALDGRPFPGQRIDDFDYDARSVTLAVVRSLSGLAPPLPAGAAPEFRLLVSRGQEVPPQAGRVAFEAQARPKRLVLVPELRVETPAGPELRHVAFVTLSPDADGEQKLAVIDYTNSSSPALVGSLVFPASLNLGFLQSPVLRADGLLAVNATQKVVLVDPRLAFEKAAEPVTIGLHPAIRSVIPVGGSSNFSIGENNAGLRSVALGARNALVMGPPKLSFVQFPGLNAVVDPTTLRAEPERLKEEVLPALTRAAELRPARFHTAAGVPSALSPPSATAHYHVLVEAPGGAGLTIPLLVESLNESGKPLNSQGIGYPPVRAGVSVPDFNPGGAPVAGVDAPAVPLRAHRLSDDLADPAYNLYLSEPIAVVREKMSISELDSLRQERPRAILWSESAVRATIDVPATGVLVNFAADYDPRAGVYQPRVAAVAFTLPGGYVPGSTPPPVGGELAVPGTFGTIDAASGEFRHTTVDLELPGRRMPIVFERTATNHALAHSGFGRGWDFNYNQRAIELKPEMVPPGQRVPVTERGGAGKDLVAQSLDIILSDGSGHTIVFENKGRTAPAGVDNDPLVGQLGWPGAGGEFYLPATTQKGVFDLMYRYPSGEMARLTPDGTLFRYGSDGRLLKVEDRYPGNHHLLDYNANGELVRIRDASVTDGRALRLGYYRKSSDPVFDSAVDKAAANEKHAGKICTLLDFAGRRVDFEYDDAGMLTRRFGVEVAGANGGFSGRSATIYQINQQTRAYVGVIAGNGASGGGGGGNAGTPLAVAQTAANAKGEAVAQGTAGAGGAVSIGVPPGRDASTVGAGATQVGHADGSATSVSHDANGYPARLTMTGPNAAAATYETTHNDRGLPETVTYPEGNSITYEYEPDTAPFRARANVVKITRNPGPRGGETLVSEAAYDHRYNLPSGGQKDFNGNTIAITLRGDGRDVLTVSYPKAGTHRFSHNDFGQQESETTPEGITIGIVYDGGTGYVSRRTLGGFNTGFGYDSSIAGKLGLPTTLTPPRGAPLSLEYDARLQRTRLARGTQDERTGYDENGNVVFTSRALGDGAAYNEAREYSQINFLNKLTVRGVETAGGSGDLVTTFTPDALFRVKTVTLPGGEVREFDYDHLGHATQMKLGAYVENYGRDLHGNLTSLRQGGDLVREIVHDGHDRPTEIKNKTGAGGDELTTLTYFGKGELKSRKVTGPVGGDVVEMVVGEVDEIGRPLATQVLGDQATASISTNYNGLTTTTSGPVDTVTATHNAAGYPLSRSDSLRAVTFTPDQNGNIERVASTEDGRTYQVDMAYNGLDHLTLTSDPVGTILQATSLRSDGLPLTMTDGRGHSLGKAYSRLGELLSLDKPEQLRFAYAFDQNRQPASVQDRGGSGNTTAYADGTLRPTRTTWRDGSATTFDSPDGRNLPTSIAIPGGSLTASYDLQGRPLSLSATYTGGAYRLQNAAYDALGRLRGASYGGTGQFSATYGYDKLGPLTSATYNEPGGPYIVGATIRADGARRTLTYPSGVTVTETRQNSGRLSDVSVDGGSMWNVTAFAGSGQPATIERGPSLTESNLYDARRRLLARRFTGPGGALLEDLRFAYDATDNVTARQALAGGGRADVFAYDDANRLLRAEYGVRPVFQGTSRNNPAGLQGGEGFAPGLVARTYGYDGGGLDLLQGGVLANPDALPSQTAEPSALAALAVPHFAAALGGHDGFLLLTLADGFTRSPDPLGNTARAQLLVRPATGAPSLVSADLAYNAHSNLVRLQRGDGVLIENQYRPDKLLHHRKVTGGDAPGERALVWHEGRLLEEYDLSPSRTLVARYYYANGDPPVAADLRQSDGTFLRVHYFWDQVLSVVAVADDAGTLLERVRYDAWGQPLLTTRDEAAPRLAEVRREGNDLLVVMSEPVLPPLNAPAGDTLVPNNGNAPAQAFRLVVGGNEQAPSVVFEENAPDFPFGSVFRLTPTSALSGAVTLRVLPDTLVDAWNNPVAEENLTFTFGSGPLLATGDAAPGSTAPEAIPRSRLGNPWLWQGQWFDYDAGLVYMRARHYDPAAGHFLQRDPEQYEDSVNLYAAMANNTVSLRDPSGTISRPPISKATRGLLSALDDAAEEGTQIVRGIARKGADAPAAASSRRAAAASAPESPPAKITARGGVQSLDTASPPKNTNPNRLSRQVDELEDDFFRQREFNFMDQRERTSRFFTRADDTASETWHLRDTRPSGFVDVLIHGGRDGSLWTHATKGLGRQMKYEEVAQQMLARGYRAGTPIRLLACHSGKPTYFAEWLSKRFNTRVLAADTQVGISPRRGVYSHDTGQFGALPEGATPSGQWHRWDDGYSTETQHGNFRGGVWRP